MFKELYFLGKQCSSGHVNPSPSVQLLFFTCLCSFLVKVVNIKKKKWSILDYLFILLSFSIVFKIKFPPKWPFQLEALYLDIHILGFLEWYISEIIIFYCTKQRPSFLGIFHGCLFISFKSSLKLKTQKIMPINSIFSHYHWTKQNFENLFCYHSCLLPKNLSSSTCCLWLSIYRTLKLGWEGLFESKTKWVSQNCYSVWWITRACLFCF